MKRAWLRSGRSQASQSEAEDKSAQRNTARPDEIRHDNATQTSPAQGKVSSSSVGEQGAVALKDAAPESGEKRSAADVPASTDAPAIASTYGAPQAVVSNPPAEEKSGKAKAASQALQNVKPLDIVVPAQIGRYTIGRRIGSGTCGVVHQSLDNLLGREVAVKLSPIGEAHVSSGKVPGAQRAYQTEIIAAGKLTHPNIVTVYDAGQFEDLNYLVMEAVEGKSLKEYGKGKTLLPVGEALRIISTCALALDYSHNQGILHRDIKPANIMLAYDGGVKLLDFGIAVGLSDEGALKKKGPTLGTPNYMSPETDPGSRARITKRFLLTGYGVVRVAHRQAVVQGKKGEGSVSYRGSTESTPFDRYSP